MNWTATLAQEVEVAGQRGSRLAAVNSALEAQRRRLDGSRQTVSSAALKAFWSLRAADEAAVLATEAATLSASIADVASARARESLSSQVDADVTAADAWRLSISRLEAQRRKRDSHAVLASLLGTSAESLSLEDASPVKMPFAVPALRTEALIPQALETRGEPQAARAEVDSARARVSLARRERIPNSTLSLFAQRDGFNERVLGVGLSLPVPLWRNGAGEVQEARARVVQAQAESEAVRRRVSLEVERALADYQSRLQAMQGLPPELVTRARAHLKALATEVRAGRLGIRDALLNERGLLEFLASELDARLALTLAGLELRRAAALPLLEVTP